MVRSSYIGASDMKPGDMVTWTQRPDLREWPPPYRRLGLILQHQKDYTSPIGENYPNAFEVLWLKSENTTWHNEDGLEVVSESR